MARRWIDIDVEIQWTNRGWKQRGDGTWYDPENRGPFFLNHKTGEMVSVEGTTVNPQEEALAHRRDYAQPTGLLIQPEVDIEAAKKVWDAYKDFREYILKDPACADDIEGNREMNRTGATRLAVPFGLSIEERATEEKAFRNDAGSEDTRFTVHVRVGKGLRYVDGVGSCRVSEITEKTKKGAAVPYSQREHFAYTKAWTRAVKRGIADILGGTEAD